ncbi:MAG: hypothetical protein J7647_11635 [Cyanobacteria bacterium SBLK]|nr:hypothetical protein [Cyanobacteria bacterium SBLK]
MIDTLLDRVGNWNPQLLRELKGRLTPKNMVIAAGVSAVGQIFLYLLFNSRLIAANHALGGRHRFCTGSQAGRHYYERLPKCIPNGTQGSEINLSLWSLDFFTTLSIIGIIGLFVVGIYLLIDDLAREEKRGTLNFIRLSPQNSKNILLGKLLGVPILVYLGVLLLIPLHFGLGVAAHIPPHLIFAFYGIVALSCFFFYSAALLFALTCTGLGGLQAWLGSGLVFGFLLIVALNTLENHIPFGISSFDWLAIFYPGYLLPYLVAHTPNDLGLVEYLNVNDLGNLTWFKREIWSNSTTAFAFTLVNYGLGIFLLWNGLDRRFHNRSISSLSKGQSYWLSSSIIFVLIGFAIQNNRNYGDYADNLFDNFLMVLILQLFLFCGLIAALTPHRKTLQTWSRYRHQTTKQNLLWDLMWGEKSPATLAIALNLISVSTIFLTAIALVPLENYRLHLIIGLVVSDGVILLYASLVQWLLLQKTKQRVAFAIATITILLVLLPVAVSVLRIPFSSSNNLSIFDTTLLSIVSAFPVLLGEEYARLTTLFSLIGQSIAIAAINVQMTRQLNHLGESDVKALLSENSRSRKQLSGVS